MPFRNVYRISDKIKKIKLIIIDVDGVLSDGKAYMIGDGKEIRVFNVRDGSGIVMAHRVGLRTAIVSGRKSKIVENWAKNQGIKDIFQNIFYKIEVLDKLKKKYKLQPDQIAYIGDDMIDIPILREAGLSIAVSDASEDVRKEVDYVTRSRGGQGAVRELLELILKTQRKWEEATEVYFKKV